MSEYTYKVLQTGQSRAFGDSEKVVEVYLKEGLTKEEASDIVREMNIGFNDAKNVQWYDPKLRYFIEKTPGVWEFKMVSAYTG